MKKFFQKIGGFFCAIGRWFKNHMPTRRRIIQLYAALLTNANIKGFVTGRIYTGPTKNFCVPGLNCYSCPGAIGACPLGALQNALATSGVRTPIFMIGILALIGILLGRTVCGFLCPLGFCQDLAYKVKTPKLKKSRVTRVLSYFKYVLLVVLVILIPLVFSADNLPVPGFCKYICPAGTLGGAVSLLAHPDNANLYDMLGALFTWKFALLVVFIVGSIFIYRFFCRFFCPLGAIYGFFNKIALLGVKLDKNKCTNCGLCTAHCKMDIRKVGDHECINCGECISVCPAKAISWKGSSLFVRPNETEIDPPKVPLGSMLQPAADGAPQGGIPANAVASENVAAVKTAQNAAPAAPVEAQAPAEAAAVAAPRPFISPKAARILKTVVYVLMTAVLIGALVYYNFFDAYAAQSVGSEVGDAGPDFTVTRMNGEEFTLSETVGEEGEGKAIILNFWYTACGPCVEELPTLLDFAAEHADTAVFMALRATWEQASVPDLAGYLENMGWDAQYFAEDKVQLDENGEERGDVFDLYGGREAYPVTVIIDPDGTIAYSRTGKLGSSPEEIYAELQGALDEIFAE